MTIPVFLHGLESSGKGTKGTYLSDRYPHIGCPDFTGSLEERLHQFTDMYGTQTDLVLIGSSYGGLMATCYAVANPDKVAGIVLLAPALNFEGYTPPPEKISVPTLLVMGKDDDVCPPDLVEPLAVQTFSNLETIMADDDHMLHNTFQNLDWNELIHPSHS